MGSACDKPADSAVEKVSEEKNGLEQAIKLPYDFMEGNALMDDACKANCLTLATALKAEGSASIKISGFCDKDSMQDWQTKLELAHSRACILKDALGAITNKVA